jgi:hypothetical protein
VNTFHVYKPDGALVLADLGEIGAAFYDWWHNRYRTQFGPSIVLDVIEVRKLDPGDPLALDYTTGLPEGGTRTSGDAAEEPANVSLTMSWRTGLAGRKYRGRNYIPGIGTTDVTTLDTINSTAATRIASIAAQLLAGILTAGFQFVVFHVADNTVTEITDFVIEAILDSQRRRLPGRGR